MSDATDFTARAEDPPVRAFPFSARVRVRTYELDSFGHVNNSVYLNYAEEARSEYLKQIGLSFHDFAAHNIQLVIVEATVRYILPARYGDDIEIRGRFTHLRAASVTIEYELRDANDRRHIADITTRGAFVNPQTGKPTRPPAAFRDAFARLAPPD